MSIIYIVSCSTGKEILAKSEPLTKHERQLVLDRLYQLERDIATIQHEACAAARDLDALRALIANDEHAMTFQSLAQYRSNLIKFITRSTQLRANKGQR